MNSKKSHYTKDLKNMAQNLRSDSTLGEVILWDKVLKNKKMGYQFNRQFSMKLLKKKIIVDFICRKLKLIIEIDGYSHNFKYDEDIARDKELKTLGYKVLRFTEYQVKQDLNNVIRKIEYEIKEINPPTPFSRGISSQLRFCTCCSLLPFTF